MAGDPRTAIAQRPMRALQIVAVALCVTLNALDGFDVLAISFAAPGIAAEWGIERVALGVVLSMELIGMAVGSVLLGGLSDRLGRRPVILACLLVMASGMLLAALSGDVLMLAITRLYTGLGIGGMLAATSAMVAEYSNDRRRDLNVMLNIAGYSAGAIIGGLIASTLLAATGDWRAVFLLGAGMTAALIPFAWFWLPESIEFLIARRPSNALVRVNRTLARLKIEPATELPAPSGPVQKASFTALFSPAYRRVTILLTLAYFAQILSFYYLQKWTAKLVVDMGFDAATAARVLVCVSVGGLLGAVILGLIAQRAPLKPIVIGSMLIAFASITVFGMGHSEIGVLAVIVAIAGFFTNGGVVGMYPIMARTFPAALRAGGTGFVIGVGRGGSAVGPILAGGLFSAGAGTPLVSMVMGGGAVAAALFIALLPRPTTSD
ncbi:MFS transporter [Caulobacter segnis]|uniref:MFS transporter n=1 Tax=Caulobacter segnis TaxID=88688 RepID=UPI00240EACEA|nr:MFS transporter [Caulobacter segnis]MDG2523014.1 MFS transporter [Caulobacter segnis]